MTIVVLAYELRGETHFLVNLRHSFIQQKFSRRFRLAKNFGVYWDTCVERIISCTRRFLKGRILGFPADLTVEQKGACSKPARAIHLATAYQKRVNYEIR